MTSTSRRPKLSLQIASSTNMVNATAISSTYPSIFGPSIRQTMEPISAVGPSSLPFGRSAFTCERKSACKLTPLIASPRPSSRRPGRPSRHWSSSDSEASEGETKFWSGEEEISSATSSEDESSTSDSENNSNHKRGHVMPIPKPLESPFLPPAPAMQSKKRTMQLRLVTAAIPAGPTTLDAVTPVVAQPSLSFAAPAKRTKLSLMIPSSISSSVATTPANSRKSSLSSGSGRKKSVSFSPLPDVVIENTRYTLSNSDLLSYLSSGECSDEELSERWGLSSEDAKVLGAGGAGRRLSAKERRERKWLGLTNDMLSRKRIGENQDECDEEER